MSALLGSFLWMQTAALSWEWDSGYAPSGDSLTWHMCEGNFSSAEEEEITKGANGWDAGSSYAMRGALWDFVRGTDRSEGSCALDNGYDEVYMRSAAWFSSHGASSKIAFCFCDNLDGLNDRDIAFRSSVSWSTNVPSATSSTSIGQSALHEFGHLLGFLHEEDLIATMNPAYAFGGDISDMKYRPQEDDYVGLVEKRPGSSTGRNLMLSKFEESVPGDVRELWVDDWIVCNELVSSSSSGPEDIYALIHATSTQSPEIEWWLSADTTCFSGTEYFIGSKTITLSSGTPAPVSPTSYDFRGIPLGDYYVCAIIDPDDDISESDSSDADNDLRSEGKVTVEACP